MVLSTERAAAGARRRPAGQDRFAAGQVTDNAARARTAAHALLNAAMAQAPDA